MPITDIEKRPDLACGKPCLAKSGEIYTCYLDNEGDISLSKLKPGMPFRWFNPKTGEFTEEGLTESAVHTFSAPDTAPWVLLVGERKSY